MKIVKTETFRSEPLLNMTDNMVRVTLDMSRNEWVRLGKEIRTKIRDEEIANRAYGKDAS